MKSLVILTFEEWERIVYHLYFEINADDPRQLHLRVTFERLKFLESIARKPEQKGFLEGWKNRVAYLTYE